MEFMTPQEQELARTRRDERDRAFRDFMRSAAGGVKVSVSDEDLESGELASDTLAWLEQLERQGIRT